MLQQRHDVSSNLYFPYLVQSFDSVKSPLGEESTIVLMCRRIGDCNNVSMYTVVIPGVQSCNASLPMESVVPCPLGFTGFTLELTKVHILDLWIYNHQLFLSMIGIVLC